MEADQTEAVAWRAAVRKQMAELGWTYRHIADALTAAGHPVTRQAVEDWVQDTRKPRKPPAPDVVFALEDVMGCRGLLSGILGYQRKGFMPTVESAVQADGQLRASQKQLLLEMLATMRQSASKRQR